MRYFITFTCDGARLHGDESGSVDRRQNLVGSRLLAPDAKRVIAERRAMLQYPYVLDEADRAVALVAIRKHCAHRGWNLLAAHEFKSYASRERNRLTGEGPDRKRSARHGCGRTRTSGRLLST